jgi:hypothetical protein
VIFFRNEATYSPRRGLRGVDARHDAVTRMDAAFWQQFENMHACVDTSYWLGILLFRQGHEREGDFYA